MSQHGTVSEGKITSDLENRYPLFGELACIGVHQLRAARPNEESQLADERYDARHAH